MFHNLKPNGSLHLHFGALSGTIIGGPFEYSPELPAGAITVKLAQEIKLPCSIDLPIRDFSTPNEAQAQQALRSVIREMVEGKTVYAGCMAGRGRTGLFLALLTKVAMDYDYQYRPWDMDRWLQDGPVEYVREHYYSHAVETDAQYKFVEHFDTTALVEYVASLQPVPVPFWTRVRLAADRAAAAILEAFRGVFGGRRDA